MEKTPIEWLIEQVNSDCLNSTFIRPEIIKQAKSMEKGRREKDFIEGYKTRAELSNLIFDESSELFAKELFNQTYKSE